MYEEKTKIKEIMSKSRKRPSIVDLSEKTLVGPQAVQQNQSTANTWSVSMTIRVSKCGRIL